MDRQSKILTAQFMKAIAEPNEFIKFHMDENDKSTWYILLSNFAGDHDEFTGGEYLVQMKAPANFPFEPPFFTFYTRNGVYDINCKVCISIGEYHKDQYRATLGMSGFATQLISGMVGWKQLGHGISIINTTLEEKRAFAEISAQFNREKYPEIIAQVNNSFDQYKKKWDVSKIPEGLRAKLDL